jgi:hypothetical protein
MEYNLIAIEMSVDHYRDDCYAHTIFTLSTLIPLASFFTRLCLGSRLSSSSAIYKSTLLQFTVSQRESIVLQNAKFNKRVKSRGVRGGSRKKSHQLKNDSNRPTAAYSSP